jgi:ABC-type sugar transport system permease subunit
MTAESPPVAATQARGSGKGGGGLSWAALAFLGPAALLLAIFLVYPTIYTFLLSFDRGRSGEFSNWVGLDNWIRLFTQDPNFLRLGIPPS